ncbi:MAG: NAD(P)/FAD-dependent oxidoreductase, partial [Patescibacteria group bacterium]
MKKSSFDVVIIGGGSAGFSAAESARAQGARVCVIEKAKLGGECPNEACIPTKALLRTAHVYRTVQHAREFGVKVGSVSYDFSGLMQYRKQAIETMTGGGPHGVRYEKIFKSLGVHVKFGAAQFLDSETVTVGDELVSGKTFVIATGVKDFVPPIAGIETVKYLNWKQALSLPRQPKSMAIIGGGPVACEIATFYATFGTRVVLIQSAPRMLHREDEEISALAQEALEMLKIEVVTNANVTEVLSGGGGVFGVHVDSNGSRVTHAVEQIVLAAGRRANTDGLDLAVAGVDTDNQGSIITTKEQQTTIKQIFAAGDVDGGMQFTNTAHMEGSIAGYNAALLALKKRSPKQRMNTRVVPRITFIEPEVASVGMTQEEGTRLYKKVLVGRAQMSQLGRSVTEQKRFGFLKIVAHPKTGKILGAHIIGERSGEIIHEIAIAMHLNATIYKL